MKLRGGPRKERVNGSLAAFDGGIKCLLTSETNHSPHEVTFER